MDPQILAGSRRTHACRLDIAMADDSISLAACMMVSKTVRTLTEHHYEPGFIADYELQQSKWSRKAFVHDVKTIQANEADRFPTFLRARSSRRKLYGCCNWRASTTYTTSERTTYANHRIYQATFTSASTTTAPTQTTLPRDTHCSKQCPEAVANRVVNVYVIRIKIACTYAARG